VAVRKPEGRIEVDKPFSVIAIVDDDEPLREALGSVMKAAGFSPRMFASAEDFLGWKDCQEVGCLILDVRLPGMSGIELQKQLNESGSTVPVIFASAHGDASLRECLMRAGACAFLSKPVRSGALLKEICKALEKNKQHEIG
jgi:two-component system, LuxR family, response regulator FixJ